MKRLFLFAMTAGLTTICEAQVQGGIADVAIIDRDSGAVLSPHFFHGEYWVAGRPGARYAIEIRNRLGERMLAVTSVDGVNVVSGATAAWDQTGYVFGSGERYQITGWRKTDAEVAAFTFTDSPNSYAERTGRPANVGVIGVALFLECPAPVRWFDRQSRDRKSEESGYARNRVENSIEGGADGAARAAPPSFAATAPAEKLGTGHGARETSYVQDTTFDRLSSTPNELIRIRYDSYANLVAMGVVPTRPTWQRPNPFPDSPIQRYVPDPPGG